MALYVLPEKPTFGEMLGTNFGTGLSSGLSQSLQMLAQNKLNQLAQRQQQQRTQQGFELIQQGRMAEGIPLLPSNVQPEFVKNLRLQGQRENLQNIMDRLSGGKFSEAMGLPTKEGQPQPGGMGTTPTFGAPTLSEHGIDVVSKFVQKQSEEKRKDVKEQWRYNKKFLREVGKKAENAARALPRYAALRELTQTGKMPNPTFYNVVKKFGGETFSQLFNPKAEQYNKIIQDFVKNIKDVFGTRITEKQIEEFLKSLPTLANTDEGKMRILDFLELTSRAEFSRGEAINNIIDNAGGVPPYNLQMLASKATSKIYDDLGENIVSLISDSKRYLDIYKSGGKIKNASQLKTLPDGTIVWRKGKRYTITNGRPVLAKGV
jgi:hypothetical protein